MYCGIGIKFSVCRKAKFIANIIFILAIKNNEGAIIMKSKWVKKIIVTSLTLGLLLGQNLQPAKAEETTESTILSTWNEKAPDYYGGIEYISERGFYIIYLKENTEENQKNVLKEIPENTSVVFASSTYSRNELKVVEDEITAKKSEYKGLLAWGITSICSSMKVKEPKVVVSVLKGNYDETSKKLLDKYGDKVVVENSAPITTDPLPITTPSTTKTPTTKVKLKSVKIANKKIAIKWKKNSSASKYKVCIYKNGKKLVDKTIKKTVFKYKIKGKVGKKYTVKIKAYNKTTETWGLWTTKTIK